MMRSPLSVIRLGAIIKKEFIHIRRDPPSLAIGILMPLMMILLFGYAVNFDVDNIPLAVWDADNTTSSREIVENFVQTGHFTLEYRVGSFGELEKLLDTGQARAGLVIPAGYSRQLKRGEAAELQFLVDGSDPLIASTTLSTAEMVAQVKTRSILLNKLKYQGMDIKENEAIDMRARAWYNPSLESRVFNIPGLIGLVLQNVTMMLTAFTLVRERERGNLEQIIVTPVTPPELMIGKLIPYVLIAFVDTVLVLALGILWFKVPINGSLLLLLSLSFFFLLFALGLGLLLSTISQTQLQAMQLTLAFILPCVLLSGFIFPRESMPPAIQLLGNMIPLTYFLNILRGIMLKGIGLQYLWKEVLLLAVFGIAVISAASLKFRKRLE